MHQRIQVVVYEYPRPLTLIRHWNGTVGEILARTERGTIKKLYTVEDYTSTLEFLTMVALTTGRLLKVSQTTLNT